MLYRPEMFCAVPWWCTLGIEYLKDVVVNDKLGIAEDLEAQMQHVVDTYQDEWATVVDVRLSLIPYDL